MNKQKLHRHGEAMLIEVESIPKKAKLIDTVKEFVVAHSESGHNHVLELQKKALRVYELDNELYLDVGDVGQLVHKKTGPDIHKTQVIAPSKYKVVIKKEFDYFSKALRQVRD
jgi:hypothetical protein